MAAVKSALIITNLSKERASSLHDQIMIYLVEKGIHVQEHSFDGNPGKFLLEKADLAIVLGGDGTVLYSARLCVGMNMPILAINLGTFGFLAEVNPDEWITAFESFQNGTMGISHRIMLNTVLRRDGKDIASFCCLNDCVISSTGMAKIVNLKVNISNQEVIEYRADGIILATSTGSTAYSMAAGGPIVHPELSSMVVNPINPFTLSNRPLVIPAEEEVTILVSQQQRTNLVLTLDGQDVIPLILGDEVITRKHRYTADLLSFKKMNFYEVVRKKLDWKGGPHD
ncbi:NAD(+)/NADH kinase [Oceanispirochaeta sp.]|jgi:NAD+ kinase|uniref:NAD(+)/NADH kinase n=1 Tax=Oceanispirochaeta sp. TaxID=2035350 RepID=UPI002638CD24|nr:NAD(+)/NADH kinase [Oceanispirochaeta sp.]MDA3956230.1 NAD(+)/NADH kinase [Oceanispirochaeta sp.]